MVPVDGPGASAVTVAWRVPLAGVCRTLLLLLPIVVAWRVRPEWVEWREAECVELVLGGSAEWGSSAEDMRRDSLVPGLLLVAGWCVVRPLVPFYLVLALGRARRPLGCLARERLCSAGVAGFSIAVLAGAVEAKGVLDLESRLAAGSELLAAVCLVWHPLIPSGALPLCPGELRPIFPHYLGTWLCGGSVPGQLPTGRTVRP